MATAAVREMRRPNLQAFQVPTGGATGNVWGKVLLQHSQSSFGRSANCSNIQGTFHTRGLAKSSEEASQTKINFNLGTCSQNYPNTS